MKDIEKQQAINYLIKNNVYHDEWSGAGMFEAVIKIYEDKNEMFSKDYLDKLLKQAENF